MSLLHEIWLCDVCKYEPEIIYKFLNFFGSAEEAHKAKESKYKKSEFFSSLTRILKADKSLEYAKSLVEECERKGIHIMSYHDEDYPVYLRNGYLPPRLLFIKGERLNLNDYILITIVGSRASTRQGRQMANQLGKDLAENGVISVSGMARGIDAEAHLGALDGGGKTIAFLAGGVDLVYPPENRKLYENIIENGAVISERPPGTPGRDYYYQRRNRIMASIANGIVVVEGTFKSGTAITVKHSTDASRDLFAVPGNPILSPSELPNGLIRDGATTVLSYEDILNTYKDFYSQKLENGMKLVKPKEETIAIDLGYELDEDDKKIINYLKNFGEGQFPDDIAENCDLPIQKVSSKLTMLMIGGIVTQEPGNKYLLTRR